MLTAIATLGGLTLVLASMLALADRRLRVEEDPRIESVENMLPQSNCGACGAPGCAAFAEELVAGTAEPAGCTVSDERSRKRIAAFLGVAVGSQEKRVARLACAGGSNVARNRARYAGMGTCRAAALVGGGGKGCNWGCLGLGDCERICEFDAIRMDANALPVVIEDLCTACGDCVTVCPKDLFSLHPENHRLWVACNNPIFGDELVTDCEVACTACARCAKDAPGLISMVDNLPVVDYTRQHGTKLPIERCPTGAIVWMEKDGRATKGSQAKRVFRKTPMPDAPS